MYPLRYLGKGEMSFCTVINCMDGRVQLPVSKFSQKRFNVKYVDTITEAGPNLILAEQKDQMKIQSIVDRMETSINKHRSVGVIIVGHHDCAGNPAPKKEQIDHLCQSVQLIQDRFKHIKVIGVWVDENWHVQEI